MPLTSAFHWMLRNSTTARMRLQPDEARVLRAWTAARAAETADRP